MSAPALDHILSQFMKLYKRNKINLFLRLREIHWRPGKYTTFPF